MKTTDDELGPPQDSPPSKKATRPLDGRVRRLVEQNGDVRVLVGERNVTGPSALHPVYNIATDTYDERLVKAISELHVGAGITGSIRQESDDLRFASIEIIDDFRLFISERPTDRELPSAAATAWENRTDQLGTTLGMAKITDAESHIGWAITLPGGDAAVPTVKQGGVLQQGTPAAVAHEDIKGYDRWGDFLIGQWGEEFLTGAITGGTPREAIAANPRGEPFWTLCLFDTQGTETAVEIADQVGIGDYTQP